MHGKTLYVSDLDGTLLRSDQSLSPFTVETIRKLCAQGMIFSYATARSFPTAMKVTPEIAPKIPVIVKNGAHIMETGTERRLHSEFFSVDESRRIFHLLEAYGLSPIVYLIENDGEINRFCPERINEDTRLVLAQNGDDPRYRPCAHAELICGDVFYFRCIDTEDTLRAAYDALLQAGFRTLLFSDMYSDTWWLEVMPHKATKADGILRLKEMLGCDRIVCFGDGSNDESMFRIADERYAMANAEDSLKAIATAVIGSNDGDGVAKWLLENFKA